MKKSSSYKTREKSSSVSKNRKKEKRDKRIYEKGAAFESIFIESKDFTKDEFYQLITFSNIKEAVNQKIIEERGRSENQNEEIQEEKRK